jgi:hypothetical protein
MSRKKISTTIYVTPEQSERLRLLHERTKVPVAVYIREGIDLVLREYDHLLPGQLPLATPRGDSDTPPPPSVDGGVGSQERGRVLDATSASPSERPGSRVQGDATPERAAGASKV